MLKRLFLVLALAYTYAVLGWLSLKVSIPPDYISMVFLPAGLALGATLVWGRLALPAIYLGALAVQFIATEQASLDQVPWNMWVTPLGAAVMAWVSAGLMRRWVGYPTNLDMPGRVVLFLLVIAPLGAMVNASLSVPLLVAGQVIAPQDGWTSWLTWWMGDALGTVLITPMVLCLFGQPAEAWRPRIRTVTLPMGVALVLTGVAIYQVRLSEEVQLQRRFDNGVHDLAQSLQRRLDAQTDSLTALAKLMELSDEVDADAFRRAVEPWLQRYAGTQNFGWSPLVRRDQRLAFEAAQSLRRSKRYEILGRDPLGNTFRAADAPVHLPITYVEPLDSNEAVLGLDVLVLPATQMAVESTMISGQAEVSHGIRLVQESGEQRGVVMYQAVYAPHRDGQVLDGESGVKGVLSAVFRIDDVIRAAVGVPHAGELTLCLMDLETEPDNWRLAGPRGCERQAASVAAGRLEQRLPLRFGQRFWELHVRAGPGYGSDSQNWPLWSAVGTGMAAVAMLHALLLISTGHARRTERLVEQRTQELARSNASLARLAHFDPLTGLANRGHWSELAEHTLIEAKRHGDAMAVMFIDLDRFKHVNDNLGHSQGDQLLRQAAQRMRERLRERDVLARLGGDEFVILLPRLREREGAATAARKLVDALQAPFELNGHRVSISASIGAAFFPGDGEDIETLLRHADIAMYAAKAAGRNGWRFYAPEMHETLTERMLLETELRRVLSEGGQEFTLEYQPQVDAQSGQAVGVEALVRWRNAKLGLVGPDRFIPLAEECGLIEAVGQWVMRQACRDLRTLGDAGFDKLSVAVNLSVLELNRPDFLGQLRQTLTETGAPAHLLELEITESLLMQSQADVDDRLRELTSWGISLALDDFGTGYSSLAYLKRLPLKRLKIDRTFVDDVPGSSEDEAIVAATLSMAHDLGLTVVAEGVETVEQREFLLRHRCELLQGWLIARPMPLDELRHWLRDQASFVSSV